MLVPNVVAKELRYVRVCKETVTAIFMITFVVHVKVQLRL
jgi:hypothetical protein